MGWTAAGALAATDDQVTWRCTAVFGTCCCCHCSDLPVDAADSPSWVGQSHTAAKKKFRFSSKLVNKDTFIPDPCLIR